MRAMIVGLALVVTGQMAGAQDASTRQLLAMERLAPLAGSWRVTGLLNKHTVFGVRHLVPVDIERIEIS